MTIIEALEVLVSHGLAHRAEDGVVRVGVPCEKCNLMSEVLYLIPGPLRTEDEPRAWGWCRHCQHQTQVAEALAT